MQQPNDKLTLTFPWGEREVEYPLTSRSREGKYLQWLLRAVEEERPRSLYYLARLLGLSNQNAQLLETVPMKRAGGVRRNFR